MVSLKKKVSLVKVSTKVDVTKYVKVNIIKGVSK